MPGKKKGKGGDSSAEPTPASTPRDDSAADDDEEEATQGNARDGGDISKVTDFVEQKEMDAAKASQALQNIMASRAEEAERKAAEAARERELATVSIEQVRESAAAAFFFLLARRAPRTDCTRHACPQADVDLIATEMELDKDAAERTLREHGGDAVAALKTLVAA